MWKKYRFKNFKLKKRKKKGRILKKEKGKLHRTVKAQHRGRSL